MNIKLVTDTPDSSNDICSCPPVRRFPGRPQSIGALISWGSLIFHCTLLTLLFILASTSLQHRHARKPTMPKPREVYAVTLQRPSVAHQSARGRAEAQKNSLDPVDICLLDCSTNCSNNRFTIGSCQRWSANQSHQLVNS